MFSVEDLLMMTPRFCQALVMTVLFVTLTSVNAADDKTNPSAQGSAALLGSPDFMPSPEHPIGWRGDGTGQYPGAMPATEWGITLNGPFGKGWCQSEKPAGDLPGPEALSLNPNSPFNFQYLILGPFAGAADAESALKDETVPNEAELAGAEGVSVKDCQWKKGWIKDAAGNDNGFWTGTNQVAYAHTYLFFEESGSIDLSVEHQGGLKVWCNGKQVYANAQSFKYTLGRSNCRWFTMPVTKGWNRVLCKILRGEKGWFHFMGMANSVTGYSRQNIEWSVAMPDFSLSTPVVVGDKVFTTADPSDLLCFQKSTGKLLWVRSTLAWYQAVEDEKDEAPTIQLVRIGSTTLTLNSSAPLDRTLAVSPDSYQVSGSKIVKAALSANGCTVRLTGDASWPWKNDETVTVKFPGLKSATGLPVANDLVFPLSVKRPCGGDLLREFLVGELRENIHFPDVVQQALLSETDLKPEPGANWKLARSDNGMFDLNAIIGTRQNAAVHACVYLFSEADRKAQLLAGSDDGLRIVVNGKVVHMNPAARGLAADSDRIADVPLKKGWNTVLMMISQANGGWGFCLRVMDESGKGPATGVSYTSANPAKLGEKAIFPVEDASARVANEVEGAGNYALLRPKVEQLEKLNDDYARGSVDQNTRKALEKEILSAVGASKKYNYHCPGWGGGNSAPTPCTDGKVIYVWHGEAGTLGCYTLDGSRKWIRYIHPFGKGDGSHHGVNGSPLICGDILIIPGWGCLIGVDRNTGKELWNRTYTGRAYSTPVLDTIENTPVLILPTGGIVHVNEDKPAAITKFSFRYDGECASPAVDRLGHYYAVQSWGEVSIVQTPSKIDAGPVTVTGTIPSGKIGYMVGSPLIDNGLVYYVGTQGILRVADATTGKMIYEKNLPLSPTQGASFGAGVAASLVKAGGNIYVFDNNGTSVIFATGREYKQIAVNRIQNVGKDSLNQEVFESTPVFDGTRMFLRGTRTLYCISAQDTVKRSSN
jgi:outer membrane protein assembly factor BamB